MSSLKPGAYSAVKLAAHYLGRCSPIVTSGTATILPALSIDKAQSIY